MTTETLNTLSTIEVDIYDLADPQTGLVMPLVLAKDTPLTSALARLLGPAAPTAQNRTLSADTDSEAYLAVKDRGWYVYGAEVDQPPT